MPSWVIDILLAIARAVPGFVDLLNPSHPDVKKVKDILPEESKSARAARNIRPKA